MWISLSKSDDVKNLISYGISSIKHIKSVKKFQLTDTGHGQRAAFWVKSVF